MKVGGTLRKEIVDGKLHRMDRRDVNGFVTLKGTKEMGRRKDHTGLGDTKHPGQRKSRKVGGQDRVQAGGQVGIGFVGARGTDVCNMKKRPHRPGR